SRGVRAGGAAARRAALDHRARARPEPRGGARESRRDARRARSGGAAARVVVTVLRHRDTGVRVLGPAPRGPVLHALVLAALRGGLGAFTDSVVLEGRSAYQVYCCFSAPFMALDLRWARDPAWVQGHIAQMLRVQHEDGRFPWYATPRTAQVPVHHASATGL